MKLFDLLMTVVFLLLLQETQMKDSKLQVSNRHSIPDKAKRDKGEKNSATLKNEGIQKLGLRPNPIHTSIHCGTRYAVKQPKRGNESYPGINEYNEFGLTRRIMEKERRRENFLREASNTYRDKIKDRRTLFIGNLPIGPPLHRIRSSLLRVLKQYGKVESMRFRSFAVSNSKILKREALKRYQFGMQKGNMNAYVVFLDENCARSAAKACNGINLTITYNRTGGEQQKILQKSSCVIRCDIATGANYVSARSIFLGNVPFVNASEDSIRLLFRSCGDIENVRLVRDKMTGYGKGFGYIQFVNETSVHKGERFKASESIELHSTMQHFRWPSIVLLAYVLVKDVMSSGFRQL
mmetsp:Transcript_28301/g.91596  ORF Transcript_28301/g.91596 Transcript_28301/m.91596 type:complete len:352 (+) Transcript_28301:283-1338(+)